MLCLLTSCCSFNSNLSHSQKFDPNSTYSSVVKVFAKTDKGEEALSGSAFAVNKDGLLTAGHVCVGIIALRTLNIITHKIYINYYSADGQTVLETSGFKIKKIDKVNDMCLLVKHNHGLVPVRFAKSLDKMRLHDKVFITGSPLGLFQTIEFGTLVIKDDGSPKHYVILSIVAAPGNSGSPIFNENGDVISMLIAGPAGFNHIGVCVPVRFLVGFIGKK